MQEIGDGSCIKLLGVFDTYLLNKDTWERDRILLKLFKNMFCEHNTVYFSQIFACGPTTVYTMVLHYVGYIWMSKTWKLLPTPSWFKFAFTWVNEGIAEHSS